MPRKSRLRRKPRVFLVAAGVLILATAWSASLKIRTLLTFTAAYRLFVNPTGRGPAKISWNSPAEKVEGGDGQFLMRLKRKDPLGAEARAKLTRYAETSGTQGLIIVRSASRARDPEVLFEYMKFHSTPDDRPGLVQLTNSASMAKVPLALLVGIAIEEGKLASADDSIANYLTELQGDERREIKLRDLLRMTSGLRAQDDPTSFFSDASIMGLSTNLEEYVLSVPLVERPGTAFRPNSVNFQLLALILERVYQRRYSQILSEKLWKPLAAKDAFVWLDRPGGLARSYCCLSANPIDWARVGLLFLQQGQVDGKQVVPASWIREMTTPSPLSPKDFGTGLWLTGGHYEFKGGWMQNVYVLPALKVVIVRVGREIAEPSGSGEGFLIELVSRALSSP